MIGLIVLIVLIGLLLGFAVHAGFFALLLVALLLFLLIRERPPRL